MSQRAARILLLLALAGAVAVVAAAGIMLREPLVERWQIHRLEAGDGEERALAVEWLRRCGSVRALPALLDAADEDARRAQAIALRRGSSHPAYPPSVDVLGLPAAAALLEIIGRSPEEGSIALAKETLRGESAGWLVRTALARLGASAAPAVPQLLRALGRNDDLAWEVVPPTLAAIGSAARPALPLLLARIQSGEAGSVKLARVTGQLAAVEDVPAILALLEGSEPFVRRAALWAVERMGPRAATAAPVLESCLHDPDEEIRTLADLALFSVRDQRSRALLEPGNTVSGGKP